MSENCLMIPETFKCGDRQ